MLLRRTNQKTICNNQNIWSTQILQQGNVQGFHSKFKNHPQVVSHPKTNTGERVSFPSGHHFAFARNPALCNNTIHILLLSSVQDLGRTGLSVKWALTRISTVSIQVWISGSSSSICFRSANILWTGSMTTQESLTFLSGHFGAPYSPLCYCWLTWRTLLAMAPRSIHTCWGWTAAPGTSVTNELGSHKALTGVTNNNVCSSRIVEKPEWQSFHDKSLSTSEWPGPNRHWIIWLKILQVTSDTNCSQKILNIDYWSNKQSILRPTRWVKVPMSTSRRFHGPKPFSDGNGSHLAGVKKKRWPPFLDATAIYFLSAVELLKCRRFDAHWKAVVKCIHTKRVRFFYAENWRWRRNVACSSSVWKWIPHWPPFAPWRKSPRPDSKQTR